MNLTIKTQNMLVMPDWSAKDKINKSGDGPLAGAFMIELPSFNSKNDNETLKYAIDALGVIQGVQRINKILGGVGKNLKIDVSIFYKVMERILNDKMYLSDGDIEHYFNESRKLDSFSRSIAPLSHIALYFVPEVEFLILGFDSSDIQCFRDKEGFNELTEVYDELLQCFLDGTMLYEEFIGSVMAYLNASNKRKKRHISGLIEK